MDNDKLEKVIKGLEVCTNPATKRGCLDGICPYDGKGCRVAMERDALELLKEQVQKETPTTMERINVVKVDGNDFYKGFCPACQTLQYGIKSKYCDQCGQAVKWK